ncbi:MAG: non-homologous end-joining DNA ligase, partial [Verrucomicrobiota bacterium]
IRYYLEVAPFILPHLKSRPVTLIRFPEGVMGESFYEKNAPRHAPDWVETYEVPRQHHEGHINYILINNAETLAWCANLGAIELHPFLHRVPEIDRPTHVAFDLDPGEGADIFTCIEVALLLRKVCEGLGLDAYPKVSGSKGIQIYVPLNTPVDYATTGAFAKSVAELLAQQHPHLIVSAMSKALRKKKVMIDWSQNSRSKTTVSVYSMRGKRDEPFISMPLKWDEIERAKRRKKRAELDFTPEEALARLKKVGDLFAPVLTKKQKLPKAFLGLTEEEAGLDEQPTSKPTSKEKRSLKKYAEKRDFTRTAEPTGSGKVGRTKAGEGGKGELRFVIQKHAATNLHYDFRLEMEGTLKSWAVPKGPPYELGVKRAAFEVEDHPLDYMNFEGTIPKGQYGGGTVMVWDIGTYELLGGSHAKGDLKLHLHGKKLKGEWHIFRIKNENDKPLWLLAKSKVAAKAMTARQDDMSVLTRRSLARIASDNDASWQSGRSVQTGRDTKPVSDTAASHAGTARRVKRAAPKKRRRVKASARR